MDIGDFAGLCRIAQEFQDAKLRHEQRSNLVKNGEIWKGLLLSWIM
jgi:hypothetical protein